MELTTILDNGHRHGVRLSACPPRPPDNKTIGVDVRPDQGASAVCSGATGQLHGKPRAHQAGLTRDVSGYCRDLNR